MGEQHSAFWGQSEEAPVPIGLASRPPDPPRDNGHDPKQREVTGSGPPPGIEPTAPRSPAQDVSAFRDDYLLRARAQAPQQGWRKVLHQASLGLLNLGPSPAELARRQLEAEAKSAIPGCRRIAVISRKGGVGKTTTTLMLGHSFAGLRGDRVVALDGNPDAGSLGYRVTRQTPATVTDLLTEADSIARYSDVRAFTSQAPSRLEVVASDDDPRISQALIEGDYARVVDVLERHYNLILLDTGTGILDSATRGILSLADQLVVVMAPSLDGARAASLTLDWLDEHGHGALTRSAVAVINAVRSHNGLLELGRVAEHFELRCRAVVEIPWDAQLEAGAESALDDLARPTRDAYLGLAAAVADGFGDSAPRQPPRTSVSDDRLERKERKAVQR
ncbi:MAG: AAA family ATPase [Candidatus Rokuibacteriota bacterium]